MIFFWRWEEDLLSLPYLILNNKIISYFEIAAKLAISKNDRRHFLMGAIAIRKDGAMVKAINSPTQEPDRRFHAEYKLANKLDVGSTVYVVRIRLIDGRFGIARPCKNCQKVLISKRVEKVYYTISPSEWGLWLPQKDEEQTFSKNHNDMKNKRFL